MLVWMGDFNYRIDLDYDTVVHLVRNFRKGDRNALGNLLQEVWTRPWSGVPQSDFVRSTQHVVKACLQRAWRL